MKDKKKPLAEHLLSRGISIDSFKSGSTYYKWLIDTVLNSNEIFYQINDDWEYKSIAQLSTEQLCSQHPPYYPRDDESKSPDNILRVLAEGLSRNMSSYILYSEEGLILYAKKGNKYIEATKENNDYSFALRLSHEGGLGEIEYNEPPKWATNLYINKNIKKLFSYFYYDLEGEEYTKSKKLKANAIRACAEGLFDENHIKNSSQNKLQEEDLDPRERKTWGQIVNVLCKECDISLDKPFKAAEIIQQYAAKHSLEIPVKTDTIVKRIKDLPEN